MKQLLFLSLLLVLFNSLYTQDEARIMGISPAINFYSKNTLNYNYFNAKNKETQASAGLYYYYHSFHKIKGSNLYLTTGSRILYDFNKRIPFVGLRFGLGLKQEIAKRKYIYYSLGPEFNSFGTGLYGMANIIFKKDNTYFVLSPEINALFYRVSRNNNNKFTCYMISAGCGLALGWDKKEFYPDKGGKKAFIHPFNTSLSLGYFHQGSILGPSYRDNNYYISISGIYRIFETQIISPEVGFGFLYAFGKTPNIHHNYFESFYTAHYAIYQDFMPYLKLGYGIQTRKKTAFIANFSILPFINFKSAGNSLSLGIKHSISKDLAASLSIERTIYAGKVWGNYRIYEQDTLTNSYKFVTNVGSSHIARGYNDILGIKLGVHF